jgi:putative oxidoreductase
MLNVALDLGFATALHIRSILTQNTRPMSIFEPAPPPWPSRMLALLRIVAGLVFLSAGTMIVFGYPPSPVAMPPFSFTSQIGIGGILEVLGGLAIVLGVFTRPVAFVLAGEMAVAYFQFHLPQSFFPTVNNGVAAVVYCFLFLYLMVAGAGEWSIDAILARKQQRPAGSLA